MHWTKKVKKTLGHKPNQFHFFAHPHLSKPPIGGEFEINERRKLIATRSDHCPYKADWQTPTILHQATCRLAEVAGHGLKKHQTYSDYRL